MSVGSFKVNTTPYAVRKLGHDKPWEGTQDGGRTWQVMYARDGAWPMQAQCPIGWDERDALV